MLKRSLLILPVVLLIMSCDSAPTDAPDDVSKNAKEIELQHSLNLHDLMAWVIDPAAGVVWNSAGWVITEAGTESLAPTTDEGWADVRNAAAVLSESGNLLLLPGRRIEQRDWIEISQGMTRTADRLLQIADDQDAEALFEVGGHLYNVCLACHQQYLRPGTEINAELGMR